jgi:3-dehydroquinate synthase
LKRELKIPYQHHTVRVIFGTGVNHSLNEYLLPERTYYIITDDHVAPLYLNLMTKQLKSSHSFIIASGERSKTMDTILKIIADMMKKNISRNDVILALGGGVVGDLAGFAASVYKRGIAHISLPTTMLAQIDSSIGGKTGVDFMLGEDLYKNEIGTFSHPDLILTDPEFLKTLPNPEYLSGMGELIKYALCFDPEMFSALEESAMSIDDLVYRAMEIKARITLEDEFETGKRILLNYGHTVGHAIESYLRFSVSHGIAVCYGMVSETKQEDIRSRLLALYQKLGILLPDPVPTEVLEPYIRHDKKTDHDIIRIPVLKAVGVTEPETVSLKTFLRSLS